MQGAEARTARSLKAAGDPDSRETKKNKYEFSKRSVKESPCYTALLGKTETQDSYKTPNFFFIHILLRFLYLYTNYSFRSHKSSADTEALRVFMGFVMNFISTHATFKFAFQYKHVLKFYN